MTRAFIWLNQIAKSSANRAIFTGEPYVVWDIPFMNSANSSGDNIDPYGVPAEVDFLSDSWSSTFIVSLLSVRNTLTHFIRWIRILYFISASINFVWQVLSNAFSTSKRTKQVFFFWNLSWCHVLSEWYWNGLI